MPDPSAAVLCSTVKNRDIWGDSHTNSPQNMAALNHFTPVSDRQSHADLVLKLEGGQEEKEVSESGQNQLCLS
jgi:hypothetical protein